MRFLDLAKEYGEGGNAKMAKKTEQMRKEITTLQQFYSAGGAGPIAKKYGVSGPMVYALKRQLTEKSDPKATRTVELEKVAGVTEIASLPLKTLVEEETTLAKEQVIYSVDMVRDGVKLEGIVFPVDEPSELPPVKLNLPPDTIEQKWNHIQREIDELRQMHMKRAKEEFDLQLEQVMGRLAV